MSYIKLHRGLDLMRELNQMAKRMFFALLIFFSFIQHSFPVYWCRMWSAYNIRFEMWVADVDSIIVLYNVLRNYRYNKKVIKITILFRFLLTYNLQVNWFSRQFCVWSWKIYWNKSQWRDVFFNYLKGNWIYWSIYMPLSLV